MNHEGAGQSHERDSKSQRAPSLGLLVNLARWMNLSTSLSTA